MKSILGGSLRTLVACLLITLLGAPICFAGPPKGIGTWVWSSSAFSTPEGREKIVRFCVKHRITHLDVHLDVAHGDEPVLEDAEAFRDLILLAGEHHITTAALRGNPKMFLSENHERTMRELRAIIAFSETLPENTLFKGIKYDVEPYCTREWKAGGATPKRMMDDYLAFLREARSVLRAEAPGLWLAVDTPFWWDKEKFMLDFEGKRKPFSEHIQDLTDFIVVMSYRRSVQKVLSCVEAERRYAKRIKKRIFPSLETVKLEQDPHISFWELPNEELWKVVPQLLEVAQEDPAVGGLMIHCYRSLAEKLKKRTPRIPDGPP